MKPTQTFIVAVAGWAVVAGCVTPVERDSGKDITGVFTEPVAESIEPPVYVRPLPPPPHPSLSRKVRVNFPSGDVALQTAIVKALPFPVTVVARDEAADLKVPISVRADGITVEAYIKQLEGESGYQIKLLPEQNIVEVSALVTRTWHLPALAGMGEFNARLGFNEDDDEEEDNSSGVERSHTMRSAVAHDDDVWASIMAHAHCILGTNGCKHGESGEISGDKTAVKAGSRRSGNTWLVDNRRLGTISAGGRPQPIALLDRWLSEMVADSLRLVRLECAILDVATDERHASGIDFDAIFGDEDFVRVTRNPVASNNDEFDLVVGTVLDSGRFNLDFFIRRLARRADVKVKSRARLVVTNAATAYLNTGEVFSYLSGIESVATEGVATTSFEQSRLQVGLELAVTPRMLDDSGRILVEVVPILSSVVRFDELGDGENRVNTPVIALRQMSSQAITRSGRPVIIGGLSWDRLALDERSPINTTLLKKWLSSHNREVESRQLLIVITPWEVEV